MGGQRQATSCSATSLVLHTLLTLCCWSYTLLLVLPGTGPHHHRSCVPDMVPRGFLSVHAQRRSRLRVACWLCSERALSADTHPASSRHAIELVHKPIPLCLRGAHSSARDPLRLVVLNRLVLRLHGRYASCTAVYTLVARPLRYHPAVTASDATPVATASVCSVAGPRGPINLAGAVKVLNVLK